MKKKKTTTSRGRSHWCIESKHDKCGGKVSTLKKLATNIKISIREENFEYSLCNCGCHSPKLNLPHEQTPTD